MDECGHDPDRAGRRESLGLRETFASPTLEQWHQECLRLLEGLPFEQRLLTETYEGITLEPIYTGQNTAGSAHARGLPGFSPFIRGTRPLGYRQRPWEVAQELPYPTCGQFNAALRHDLERGQTAVVLTVDRAGQAGLDPDRAAAEQVGRDGTSVASLRDLGEALEGVDIGAMPVHIEGGPAALSYAAMLVALAERRGIAPAHLQGSAGFDPIASLAEHGLLPASLDQAYDELAALTSWASSNAPRLQTVAVKGHVYHDAGASGVQDLALMLAAGVHHLRELERRGLDIETTAPRIRCHLSVGTHFFMEIARLRAARLLWARLIEAAGGGEQARRLCISARTSRFTKTVLDPHVNILRATTEAMAAIFGQVDALHVAPFDEPLGLPGELSRRLARNTQIILREESRFDCVVDPAGGSWFVEKLTADVAEAAWLQFQEIESAGGVLQALQKGLIQDRVAATAVARRENLACRKDVLVGTNQYPLATEKVPVARGVDHAALHAQRSRDLQEQRAADGTRTDEAPARSPACLPDCGGAEVVPALVSAALAGTTVGAMNRALRREAGPGTAIAALKTWRAGEMFERLRLAVLAHPDRAAVTVFCANLGDVARTMPRLDFVRGFFQVGGFTVEADRWFRSPAEAGDAAMQSIAASAVIVGLDATCAQEAAETARQLKEAGIETILLAGRPAGLADQLRAAGVDLFIHQRSDAHAVLGELAARKGVRL